MKVHLIKKKSIEEYAENNARIRPSLRIWLNILKFADWSIPNDIIASFGTADLLLNGSDRVVFNIAGNNYRIICKYTFG
jgi:mRNA interferase HigB